MVDFNTTDIMGCPCQYFKDIDEAKGYTRGMLSDFKGGYTVAINAEKVLMYQEQQTFRDLVQNAAILIPDGAGAVMAMKLLQGKKSIKLDFPKLILELSDENKLRLFVLGATEDSNKGAYINIKNKYPDINMVGRMNGFFNSKIEVVEALKNARPQVILVALGSPKQEYFSASIYKEIPEALFVGCGGAIDVLSGKVKRAPFFIMENNIEWLYRLISEPRRIKRQKNLPRFVFKFIKAILINKFNL
jgi:N-acetylglucosaminyldiphosphoundecaprenol N-acetyl-beta-D-mannosaminyltransferase